MEISGDAPQSKTFQKAYGDPFRVKANDREYAELLNWATWIYNVSSSSLSPVLYKQFFRAEQVNNKGINYPFKAGYPFCGELQHQSVDYDPELLYAPVGTHESGRCFIALGAKPIFDFGK